MALTEIPIELSSTPGIVDNSNATAITIDSSENVGIGATPNTRLQVSSATTTKSVVETTGASSDALIEFTKGQGSGNTWSMGLDHSNSSAFSLAYLSNGSPSLTTHGLVTVNTSGNVGIGTSSPSRALEVYGAAAGVIAITSNSTDGISSLSFGDTSDDNAGRVNYLNASDNMLFYTATAERMRIDSSGNLLVGKSVTTFGTAGIALRGTVADFTRDGGTPINVNRLTSDGSLIDFHKAGTVVGSIGTSAGHLYVGNGDTNLIFNDTANSIYPWDSSANDVQDATVDLGASTARFKDLYMSGGAYLGGTTAANYLEDYEEGLWTLIITTSGTGESVSIGSTTGTYTKIGRQVTATIYTSGVNVSAAGSGAVLLGGLPFTCSNGIQFYAVPSFGHTTLFSYEPDGYVTVNTNYITVTRVGTTTSNALSVGNPRYMMMTVTYFTDS